jgi:heterodisulfide reductase subunit A
MRTYGQREALYREARERGVIFIRYQREKKPVVSLKEAALTVTLKDHVLQRKLEIATDLLVLAAAIVPQDNDALSRMFKLSVNEDGFFTEAHAKLKPVEFATGGIYLAGMAHNPKPVEESIAQAKAAASRAAVALSQDSITVDGIVSHVNELLCRGCGECQNACPYSAIEVRRNDAGTMAAVVQAALCKGCGACAVACPTGAASIFNYADEEVLTMVETAMG